MKRLILMRHAKSSWSDSDLSDIDRPLGERGRKGADDLGVWMAAQGYAPDLVIVSSATRCAETWDRVAAALPIKTEIKTERALYNAPAGDIRDIVRASGQGDTVLVVAHNPGIGAMARDIRVDPAPHHASFDKYPSGATTVLELPIDDWSALDFGTAHLEAYVTPKELT